MEAKKNIEMKWKETKDRLGAGTKVGFLGGFPDELPYFPNAHKGCGSITGGRCGRARSSVSERKSSKLGRSVVVAMRKPTSEVKYMGNKPGRCPSAERTYGRR